MILILTFKEYEQGTDPVVDWLLYYEVPFVKIFIEDLLTKDVRYRVDILQERIFVDGKDITDVISVVFFRRFRKTINFNHPINLGQINEKINRETNNELTQLTEYLAYILRNKKWFPEFEKLNVNKLKVLSLAKSVGLNIPASIISNSKKEVEEFCNQYSQLIYKPISQVSYYTFGKYTYSAYTKLLEVNDLEELPHFFFPSLFQSKIESDYEIRCFYLDGDFYASAILVLQEEKEVDIKLSYKTGNIKWMCYNLPSEIKQKLRELMDLLKLNTGSIDLIKTANNEYYFIEVNPVGQYFAPSVRCNYYVEKHIANWLINNSKT